MTCKLTMTLISESQEGNIGEDWKYDLDIKVETEGKLKRDLTIECPGPAGGTVTKELDLAVPVREMPPILPKKAVFTLRVRFTLRCE